MAPSDEINLSFKALPEEFSEWLFDVLLSCCGPQESWPITGGFLTLTELQTSQRGRMTLVTVTARFEHSQHDPKDLGPVIVFRITPRSPSRSEVVIRFPSDVVGQAPDFLAYLANEMYSRWPDDMKRYSDQLDSSLGHHTETSVDAARKVLLNHVDVLPASQITEATTSQDVSSTNTPLLTDGQIARQLKIRRGTLTNWREMARLYDEEGLDYPEIAARMFIEYDTVKKNFERMRKKGFRH